MAPTRRAASSRAGGPARDLRRWSRGRDGSVSTLSNTARHGCRCGLEADSASRGSRFLSLLQSAPDQTLSAIFGTAKKPNCRRHSRVRLGGSRAERYGKSLSECRFVSEAWGLADLLYKLFSVTFQRPSLIAQPEGWYPFAPILARSKASNLSP